MRWNCPHCGVALAVADEKLGTGWQFSKCYKCAGIAMVRRSNVNLIKVDRSDASQVPIMNRDAAERYAKYVKSQNTAKPAPETIPAPQEVQTQIENHAAARDQKEQEVRRASENKKPVIKKATPRNAPKVVPPRFNGGPETSKEAAAPVVTQPVAQPVTQPVATAPAPTPAPGPVIAALPKFPDPLPEPMPDIPEVRIRRNVMPVAIAVAAFTALASGVYLYIQGQQLWQNARLTAISEQQKRAIIHASNRAKPAAGHELVDQVRSSAMAPERAQPIQAEPIRAQITQAENAPAAQTIEQRLTVQPKKNLVNLRSGPGVNFPVVATANVSDRLQVEHWKDQWFRVSVKTGDSHVSRSAWVRSDLVDTVN